MAGYITDAAFGSCPYNASSLPYGRLTVSLCSWPSTISNSPSLDTFTAQSDVYTLDPYPRPTSTICTPSNGALGVSIPIPEYKKRDYLPLPRGKRKRGAGCVVREVAWPDAGLRTMLAVAIRCRAALWCVRACQRREVVSPLRRGIPFERTAVVRGNTLAWASQPRLATKGRARPLTTTPLAHVPALATTRPRPPTPWRTRPKSPTP